MPIENAKDEAKNVVVERLSSPIMGSFIIYWIIWNWDAVIYITSTSMSASEKIKKINDIHSFISWYLLPALSTLIYMFIIPWLTEAHKLYTDQMKIRAAVHEAKTRNDIKILESYSYTSAVELNDLLLVHFGQTVRNLNGNLEHVEKIIASSHSTGASVGIASIKDLMPSMQQQLKLIHEGVAFTQEAQDAMRSADGPYSLQKIINCVSIIKQLKERIKTIKKPW